MIRMAKYVSCIYVTSSQPIMLAWCRLMMNVVHKHSCCSVSCFTWWWSLNVLSKVYHVQIEVV